MVFSKLKPGMVVYSKQRQKAGNTNRSRWAVFEVFIESVNAEASTCMARWNGNAAQEYGMRSISKWRVKKPVIERWTFGL